MTSTATAPKAAATLPEVDFLQPAGEPALAGPDSISWRVFKNLVALYIGGIAAVLLELAEPRVRSSRAVHRTRGRHVRLP